MRDDPEKKTISVLVSMTLSKSFDIEVDTYDEQVERDEEQAALAAEYNEILTNAKSTTDEKNDAYDGLKQIDELKAKEEKRAEFSPPTFS